MAKVHFAEEFKQEAVKQVIDDNKTGTDSFGSREILPLPCHRAGFSMVRVLLVLDTLKQSQNIENHHCALDI